MTLIGTAGSVSTVVAQGNDLDITVVPNVLANADAAAAASSLDAM